MSTEAPYARTGSGPDAEASRHLPTGRPHESSQFIVGTAEAPIESAVGTASPVDDRTRPDLHRGLDAVLGPDDEDTLMAHLPPVT